MCIRSGKCYLLGNSLNTWVCLVARGAPLHHACSFTRGVAMPIAITPAFAFAHRSSSHLLRLASDSPPLPPPRGRRLLLAAAASCSSLPPPSPFVGCPRREITHGKEQSSIRRRIMNPCPGHRTSAVEAELGTLEVERRRVDPQRPEARRVLIPRRWGTLV